MYEIDNYLSNKSISSFNSIQLFLRKFKSDYYLWIWNFSWIMNSILVMGCYAFSILCSHFFSMAYGLSMVVWTSLDCRQLRIGLVPWECARPQIPRVTLWQIISCSYLSTISASSPQLTSSSQEDAWQF